MSEGNAKESGWDNSEHEDQSAPAQQAQSSKFESKADKSGFSGADRDDSRASRPRFDESRGDDMGGRRRGGDRVSRYEDARGDDRSSYRNDDRSRSRFDDRPRYEDRDRMPPRGETRRYDDRAPSRYESRDRPRYEDRDRPRYDDRERGASRFDDYPDRFEERRGGDYSSKRSWNDSDHYSRRDDHYSRYVYDGHDSRRGYDDYNYRREPRRDYGYREKRQRTRQDEAAPNETLGIFSLSYELLPRDFDDYLAEKLADYKDAYTSKLIIDRMTGRCKGFGFVTFNSIEDSTKAKELLTDGEINGTPFRVAFSIGERRVGGFQKREEEPAADSIKKEDY